MNKRKIAFPFKIIACILLCSMLLSLMPPSHAEGTASPYSVVVNTVYGKKSMSVVKKGGVWYGNINDIEDIANRRAVVNEETGIVLFTPSNNPMYSYEKEDEASAFRGGGTGASAGGRGDVTSPYLYTVDLNKCLRIDGEVYVPLQEATRSIGLEFAVFEDELLAFARYTPAEVMECVNAAFSRENYVGQAKEQYPVLWSACQTFSVVTTAFASKDFGLNEAFTGAETQEKYDTVFKSVFSHDDRTTNAIINAVETSTPTGEAIKTLKEAVEAGGGTYEQILKYFELDDTAFEIATAEDFTGISDGTLEELIKCTKLLYDISKLDVELIQTGNEIFGNSANENISLAFSLVSALVGDYYNVAILSVFARDTALSFVEKGMGTIVGTVAPTAKMLSTAVDFIAKACPPLGDAFETTENFQYLLVCTTIQDEVNKYYCKHAYDGEEDTVKKMLDAAIIYIKTALAFEDLYNNYEPNIKRLEGILNQLLSFNEYHYAPDYTNQELIDWLNEKYPDGDEYNGYGLSVFDETYWTICFGQSLGFNYSAKFSADGTFSARSMGSGAYKDGTYEFHDGYLTIYFDISGFGYESETEFYSSDGKEFKSVEKYGMQVGEDYYTIRALPEGDDFFDSGLEKEEPESVTPDPVPPEQSGGNNPAGEQWGAWSEWQDTPINADANTQVETRTVYGYYYFECPHCGAHMHGWGTVCYPWAGGCGGATPDDSGWHQIWSEISWDEANLRDWYGTGHYYTYIDGELVFQWTNDGQPKTQYRCRTKTSANAGLADGSYYVEIVFEEVLYEREYLTFDLLEVTGYAPSDNPIFEYAWENYTLEVADGCVIRDSSVFTDNGLTEIYYDDLGPILNQYGFGTIVSIKVLNGEIVYIDKFYMA